MAEQQPKIKSPELIMAKQGEVREDGLNISSQGVCKLKYDGMAVQGQGHKVEEKPEEVAKSLEEDGECTGPELVIPHLEEGGSLLSEYVSGIQDDESLLEWKLLGEMRENVFLWKDGVLRSEVEDAIEGYKASLQDMLIVTEPFTHVTIDIVAPLPRAKGVTNSC